MEVNEVLGGKLGRIQGSAGLLRERIGGGKEGNSLGKYLIPCEGREGSQENGKREKATVKTRTMSTLSGTEGILTDRNRSMQFPPTPNVQAVELQQRLLEEKYREQMRKNAKLQTKVNIMEIERGQGLEERARLETRVKDLEKQLEIRSAQVLSLQNAVTKSESNVLNIVEALGKDLSQLYSEQDLLLQTFQQSPQFPSCHKRLPTPESLFEHVRAVAERYSQDAGMTGERVVDWVRSLATEYVQMKTRCLEGERLVQVAKQAFGVETTSEVTRRLRNLVPAESRSTNLSLSTSAD